MSDLARTLIRRNKVTRETSLDLGNCGLQEIPEEIAELEWLESLSLVESWHEWDGRKLVPRSSRNTGQRNRILTGVLPLTRLRRLRSLAIRGIADLAILSILTDLEVLFIRSTLLADLMPLNALTKLVSLSVRSRNISDVSALASLSNLRSLDLSTTRVADLMPLASLVHLQSLDVSRTLVTNLGPVVTLTDLRMLRASSTEVVDLAPLLELTKLQSLDFRDSQVADLTAVASLNGLEVLRLSSTPTADLTPLAALLNLRLLDVWHTRVTDLTPLRALTKLESLDVSSDSIRDLTPLALLTNLQSLHISANGVVDLTPLAGLTKLQALIVRSSQIVNLDPLVSLNELEVLDVSDTAVKDLTPVAKLANLKKLDVSRTQVADLSPLREKIARGHKVKWSSQLWREPGIYVEDCPLRNPPPEVVNQGNEAILNYFAERESSGVDHLYEAKLLLLGEGRSGKTSLLRRLYQPEMPLPSESETTKGIDIHHHEFALKNGRRFRLNVWDFGGQEIYHATHQFFLTRRSLYVLLDDTGKNQRVASDDGFKYWLDLIEVFAGRSPTLIFQNEKGGRSKAIDLAGIKGQYENVKDCHAGNLEQPHSADKLRTAIEFYAGALDHVGDELPVHWIRVRSDIEARAREVPYIDLAEYFTIYQRHMKFDRTRAQLLSRYLHDLGVFLHFQDDILLRRTIFLQNHWATEAVYRMLDDEAVKASSGRFNTADCERVWSESSYSDRHPELLALMQNFELCYALDESHWLAPQLLSPGKPRALLGWGRADDLVLRYHYDFLPRGMIARLTVRMHRFVLDPGLAWATGALLQRGSSSVLVELLANGREIDLRARGPESNVLLGVVAADLDLLNDSFRGLRNKVDKLIPCGCKRCRSESVPHFFQQKHLLQRKHDRRLNVECPNSYDQVSVLELLDGIRIDDLPEWAAKPASADQRPRRVRIFLASSSELKEDRDAFELYFRQRNDQLLDQGIVLEIVRWENFLDAMSETRLQDEYNAEIRACDVFIGLFFTKTGRFTEEEFDVAHRQFKETGKPRLYAFFKNSEVKTGSLRKDDLKSLWAFQEKLNLLGHFYTNYDNIEHLKRQFRDQLELLGPLSE
jgi:internalin A